MTTTFSAMWSELLDKAVREKAIAQCPEGFKLSTRNSKEYEAIAQAWNQGIDSHLEAISSRSTTSQSSGRASFVIHPEEVHVLVRRLMLADQEVGQSLASAICEDLSIELI